MPLLPEGYHYFRLHSLLQFGVMVKPNCEGDRGISLLWVTLCPDTKLEILVQRKRRGKGSQWVKHLSLNTRCFDHLRIQAAGFQAAYMPMFAPFLRERTVRLQSVHDLSSKSSHLRCGHILDVIPHEPVSTSANIPYERRTG